jgi:hypothetical protein
VATGRTEAVAGKLAPAVALNEGFQAGLLVAAGIVVVAVVLTAVVARGSRPATTPTEAAPGPAIAAAEHA